MTPNDEEDIKYVVVVSDQADADRDRLNLFYMRRDTEFGKRWDAELQITLAELTGFPGPLSHARDEAASVLFGREVRRLLYYGPTRRRTGVPTRILFTLLPPDPNEPSETAETVILLLRLLHGAQALLPDDTEEDTQP